MRKQKLLTGLLGCVLLTGITLFSGNLNAKASNDSGDKLTIMVWNDEWMDIVREYMPGYVQDDPQDPNHGHIGELPVEWYQTPASGGAYQAYLDNALQDSDRDVDLFLIEADYADKYTRPGIAKPLGDLGITSDDLADQYEYTKQVVTTDGVLYASTWQACGAGMIYNREIAKSVLGTDDPEAVQAMVSDWDKWQTVAGQMKAAGYQMTPTVTSYYRAFACNMTSPWVVDGTINIDSNMMKWVTMSKEMVDAGQTGTCGIWDINDEFKTNNSFCVFGPSWYFNYCMGDGDPDAIATKGGWAFCEGPQAHWWGGSWICVADKTDNETVAAEIIKSMTMNPEILLEVKFSRQNDVNSKTVMNAVAADNDLGYSVLGGQNYTKVLKDSMEKIDSSNMTDYDQVCNESFQVCMVDYFTGKKDLNTAMDVFYATVQSVYPELKVGEKPVELKNEGGKFVYYEYGVRNDSKYGFVDYNGSKFLVANGEVVTTKQGLAQDPEKSSEWYFCANGQVMTKKSGLVQYPAKTDNWFIVENGKLDTTYSGFVEYNGGKFFVASGKLVRKDGLVQDPNHKSDWYFLSKGQVQAKKTGVVIYNKAGFYVVNGKLDTSYNGNAVYNGKTVKIVNGRMK